jgi:hypothetical protein
MSRGQKKQMIKTKTHLEEKHPQKRSVQFLGAFFK